MQEIIEIKWLALPHCPPGQLSKPNESTDAGYDLMCAEDIYVPTMRELDEWGAYSWEDLGVLEDIMASGTIKHEAIMGAINHGDMVVEHGRLGRKKYKFPLVKTGVCIKPSSLMWNAIFSRSGTSTKYNIRLANSVAVIDYSYSGSRDELMIAAIAEYTPMIFRRGERIAQLVPMNFVRTWIERVDDPEVFSGSNRGGFGSTGTL